MSFWPPLQFPFYSGAQVCWRGVVRAHTALLRVDVLKGDLELPLLLVSQLLLSAERLEDLRRDAAHRVSAAHQIGLLQTLQLTEQPRSVLQTQRDTRQSPQELTTAPCIRQSSTCVCCSLRSAWLPLSRAFSSCCCRSRASSCCSSSKRCTSSAAAC